MARKKELEGWVSTSSGLPGPSSSHHAVWQYTGGAEGGVRSGISCEHPYTHHELRTSQLDIQKAQVGCYSSSDSAMTLRDEVMGLHTATSIGTPEPSLRGHEIAYGEVCNVN